MTAAIILAGGLGTRLRSVLPDLPKPMAPINGKPFLEYQMDFWFAQGIDHFILSVGYKRELIIDHFGYEYRGAKVSYAIEETPLGTGGGLIIALQSVLNKSEPILVLNGDTYFEVDLDKLKAFHLEKNSSWSFSLFHANEAGRYMGMDVEPSGRIASLKSGTEQIGRLANGGVYLLNPDVLQSLNCSVGDKLSLEDDILSSLLEHNVPLFGCEFDGAFIDIGVPSDYQRAPQIMQN